MTSTHLIQWIEHPETLDKDSLYELRTLIARYPYFHSLRLLYLKNLYLLHDATFGEELRKSALFVADRSVLFYQIEGARYALQPQQPLPSMAEAAEMNDDKDRTLFLIDSFLSSVPDEPMPTTELDYSMDYTAFLLDAEVPLESSEVVVADAPKLRGQSLIDDFLSQTEVLQDPVETPASDLQEVLVNEENVIDEEESESEIPVEEETFTETLAKIYIKQHRYDKALEIIKKLSLNYPKKNAYFADQIRFLEKLIINAKSK